MPPGCDTTTVCTMTPSADTALLDRARAWVAEDPDPTTRAELEQIIADVEGGADDSDLADRFAAPSSSVRRGCAAPSAPDPTG